jgi:hypothetical protein
MTTPTLPIKTLRDDFALIFLQVLVMADTQRQMQGFSAAPLDALVRGAYEAAQKALDARYELLAPPAPQVVQ